MLNKVGKNIIKSIEQKIVDGSTDVITTLIKSIPFSKIKIETYDSFELVKKIKTEGKTFILSDQFCSKIHPNNNISEIEIVAILNGFLLYIKTENINKNGSESFRNFVYIPRWQKTSFEEYLQSLIGNIKKEVVYIYGHSVSGASVLGGLSLTDPYPEPLVDKTICDNIDSIIMDVISGQKDKNGIILHGPPGNGKSFLVRYFAHKYATCIKIPFFEKATTNFQISEMFSNMVWSPFPKIILLEDFDDIFQKRKNQIKDSNFTFDVFLNILDGTYLLPKNTIYIVTTNNLDLIDESLKERPSRFRLIQEVPNPEAEIKKKIFGDKYKKYEKELKNMSLDKLLDFKERIEFHENNRS
jgi:hypothetical protein